MKITISGLSGCGSTTACNNVSAALGLQVVNYTMRNLAEELGKTFEQVQNDATGKPEYDFMVDDRLIKLADKAHDCVVASRLAGWLFDDADLRVWLSASLDTRAKRIASREGKDFGQVRQATSIRDEQNQKRYKATYGVDINDHEGFDIIVNTEFLTASQVSSLIVAAANLAAENKLHKPIKAAKHIRAVLAEKLKSS